MFKFFIMVAFSFLLVNSAYASTNCPETSVHEAVKKSRNEYMKDVYNDAILDPEETRKLSDCLSGIEAMGDIFSMGVSLPSVDSIFDKLCGKMDSELQKTINNTMDKVTTPLEANPVFDVVGNPDYMVNNIINNLK